ncbi:SpaA isopeptide-forming pilin-related protein [Bifidobacterium thermophilum]|nr:SpaA isopeptide-forming pilin-related protein [Bifidobacterium thermophilum]
MKTSLKRFFAGVAAAAMAVGGLALGATSAQAADSDASTAKGRLTVNAAKDATGHTLDTTGHTLKAYLVAAYNSGYQAYPQTDKDKPGQLNFDTFKYVVPSADESAVVAALKSAGVTASKSGSASEAEEGLKQLTGQSAGTDKSFGYVKGTAKASAAEREFADALAEKLTTTDSAKKWTPSKPPQDLAASDGKFTADLDPEGLYLVVDTYTPGSNKSTQSVPMLVGTTFASLTPEANKSLGVGEITMKNTEVPVTKQVVKTDEPTTPYTEPSYSRGDIVTFELSTTIPNYDGYTKNATDLAAADARKLVLTDTFEQNAYNKIPFSDPTVAVDGVKLYRGGKEVTDGVLTKDTDYTAAETADGSTVTGMTFDFGKLVNGNGTTAKNIAWQTGDVIKVVLKVTLNENAFVTDKASSEDLVSGVDKVGNANSVKVDFSDHTATGHHEVNGPTVNVYSFNFNLTKQYVKDPATKLANAQFTIKDSNGNYLKFADGKWVTAGINEPIASDAYDTTDKTVNPTKLAETGIFVTGSNGEYAFNGLKADTYTVHEIKAPKGYFQNALPSFDVKIGAEWNNDTNNKAAGDATSGDQSLKNVTYKYDTKNANGLVTADNTSSVTVDNVKSITELPKTGAAGIAFFSIIGVAIVAMAALFAVRARKAAKMA